MKRTVAAVALVIGMAQVPALCQSSIVSQIAGGKAASEKLYFSLKFGLNFSYLTGTTDAGRTGNFNVGLMATIRLTDKLSLVPEITPLSRKGIAEIPFVTTGDPALDPYFADPVSADLALDYTDIPVLLKYRLGRFHVGAGPYVGLLGSAAERFRAVLASGEDLHYTHDVKDTYKNTDFGLVFEGSWTIAKPRRGVGLIFHARYQAGLTDVLREPVSSGPVRNSVFQFYVSFPFVY